VSTFSDVGVSSTLIVPVGQKFRFALSGTWVGTVTLQRRVGNEYRNVQRFTGNTDQIFEPSAVEESYRVQCLIYTSGTITYVLAASTVPLLQKLLDRFNVEQFAVDENGLRGVVLTLSGLLFLTGVEDSLTAHAGGTQAAGLALDATKAIHRVSVCATNADSVVLPAAAVGAVHVVINSGAASLQVFGAATETIDGVASATGVAQAAGKHAIYICVSAGKWYRILSA
jgi:hypothetical protein